MKRIKMKKTLIKLLILSSVILSGCFREHDTISIKNSGDVTFKSEIEITEQKMSAKDVEKASNEFTKELKEAGWKVAKQWISKKKPYKLVYNGIGNLKTVKDSTYFYRLKRVNDKKIKIQFITASSKGGKSSRSITFDTSLFGNNAKILDSKGKEVSEIKNVLDKNWYTVILK